jgi:cellulose synthase/poly-beta-1,6-N-acetylglucosamine synthase-like glycosyltransferase
MRAMRKCRGREASYLSVLKMDLGLLLQIVFFGSVGLIAYAYIGYPMLILALSKLFSKDVKRREIEPTVTFLITAYNEELGIAEKLENTLRLDYPREKFEIVVVSDHSSDGTDSIVQTYADRGVKLLRLPHRAGKTAAQNYAVERANGEIIVFSDATSVYAEDSIRQIVTGFADPTVGCVAGKLVYVDPARTAVGSGARSYWSYERLLKESESTFCSLIGVSGCIYAVRRANYRPMYPEACSDFLIATEIYRQGLRTIYEPSAVCFEETNRKGRKEMKMRIRVISQTFTDLWRNRDMLNPFQSGFYAVQLISHKILRYSVPLFLALALLSSGLLAWTSGFFLAMFGLQLGFYALAVAAWPAQRFGIKAGPLNLPLYFVLANVASVAGFLQFLRGERYASWEPIRDSR